MRKLILLVSFICSTLMSCSSDDDSQSQDPFIGTWTWHQTFNNGVEEALDDCDKQEEIVVSADGTFTQQIYYNNNGTCEEDSKDSGLWENQGNNVYKITLYPGTNDEEVNLVTITFNDNTFSTVDGMYKDVYIRN